MKKIFISAFVLLFFMGTVLVFGGGARGAS
jgi:hypothetical protein